METTGAALTTTIPIKVPGHGNRNARVAVVSYAPGPSELRTGVPFTGKSGEYLYSLLASIGIRRMDIYTTNVFKDKIDDESEQFDAHAEYLRFELAGLPHLQYVLILGGEALSALSGVEGVHKYRGSILPIDIGGREVLSCVAFNPAHVLRTAAIQAKGVAAPNNVNAKHTFAMDIKRFGLLASGKLSPYRITYDINPSFERAIEYLDSIPFDQPLAYDIEVAGRAMVCIGFAYDKNRGICINFISPPATPRFTEHEELAIRLKVERVLASHPLLVAQNGAFDALWLGYMESSGHVRNHFDTLLAHHTLYPSLPHSLAFLTSVYTTHPYYKDDKDSINSVGFNYDQFWRYNVTDCCITLAVYYGLVEELKRAKLYDFFIDHVMCAQYHLVGMGLRGVAVDTELKSALGTALNHDLTEYGQRIYRSIGELTGERDYYPSLNSPNQISELLFDKLKLARQDSTDAETLTGILESRNTPEPVRALLSDLLKYKEEKKFVGTYINSGIDGDNRYRTQYKQYGTQSAPGRLSSSKNPWGTGGNAQNQPSRAYSMFTADRGQALFYFDLEQAEARVVGWEAGIELWIEQFETARRTGNYDCHRALAAEMWHIPYDEVPIYDIDPVTKKKTLRFIAKRCRHGLNYRMQSARLASTTGLSLDEARSAYDLYHRTTPELRRWWQSLEQEVRRGKVLFNCYGRRLPFMDIGADNALDAMVAFKPQSTIGDKVVRTIYLAQEDSRWPSQAHILLNIHDAVVGMAPFDQVDTALALCIEHAQEPLTIQGRECIIPAAGKRTRIGTKWQLVDNRIVFTDDMEGPHRWSRLEA